MPLDHYVPQVHLKRFLSPALGHFMYAIRKSDLKSFHCKPSDVCRIMDGSTNAYLINDRAVEDFLRGVEPKYNDSVAKLRNGSIDVDCIYVIAGFAAYVASCAPAAMRIHSKPLSSSLVSTAAILDRHGLIPRAPEELSSKSLTELLEDGTIRFVVDPKYPQALGVDSIIERTSTWGNSKWEILLNAAPDSPFFTSDFPVALEATGNRGLANWIVPLTPDLAIRIIPDIGLSQTTPDLSFKKFSFSRLKLGHPEIARINRLIVRCAEDNVFFRDNREWIDRCVAKNRHYRVEATTERMPYLGGFLNVSTQRVRPHRAGDSSPE